MTALSWVDYASWFARSEILRVAQNDKGESGVGDGQDVCPKRADTGVRPYRSIVVGVVWCRVVVSVSRL